MAEFEKADYGIRHCEDFTVTPDGFSLSYRTSRTGLFGLVGALLLIPPTVLIALFFVWLSNSAVLWWVTMIAGAAACGFAVWLFVSVNRKKTRISVTKDAIIVDDKHLRRSDFGHWRVFPDGPLAKIGYSYGNRNYVLPRQWPVVHATEFISDLNGYTRITVASATSAEQLRSARPSDF